jgi:transcriptional regulator with XRE-family HTH domain
LDQKRNRRTLRSREHRALISVLVASRKEAELTQGDLAARVGKMLKLNTDRSWLAKFESGDRRLDAVELIWIARALKMDPSLLLTRVVRWLETTE